MAKQTRNQRKGSGTSRKPAAKATPARKVMARSKKSASTKPAAEFRKLDSSWQLSKRTAVLIWRQRRFFAFMFAAYLVLDLLLVHSFSVFNVSNIKASLDSSLLHGAGQIVGSLTVFTTLFSSAATGASANSAGPYHFFVIMLVSLATIWALRQMFNVSQTSPISVKLAFYNGVAPLIPSLILLLLLLVQFIPVLIGNTLFAMAVGSGIAKTAIEQLIFTLVVLAMAGLTLYWVSRTIIALYIVTVPGMMPVESFRQAKDLVRGYRLSIIRKLLFLPVALFVLTGVVMIPAIIIWAPLAQGLFYVLSLLGLLVAQTYLFTLYRELLNE